MTLRAQLAEQSSTLLGNHPRIKELKAQIGDLDVQIRKEAETIARSLENDAKLADARVAAQLATFNQFKSQAVTSNEDDVQLRALEREAKSQRDLLESYLAKYREATARDSIANAPVDARVISRATVSTVPAYPKKIPTIAIASLATMVLMSGIVLTRELLDNPAAGAVARPRRVRPRQKDAQATADADTDPDLAPIPDRAARFEPAEQPARPRADMGGTLAARLRSIVQKEPLRSEPPRNETLHSEPVPIGVPVSAIDEFAHNLCAAGVEHSQIAFFATAPELDTGWVAVRFARALARDARAVLVALGSGDHAIHEISNDPAAPGLAELASGAVSFGDIITRDIASNLNLITSGPRRQPQRASRRARHYPAFLGAGAGLSACRRRCRRAWRPRRRARGASGRSLRHPRHAVGRDARRAFDHASPRSPARFRLRQRHHRDRRPRRRDGQDHPTNPRGRGVAARCASTNRLVIARSEATKQSRLRRCTGLLRSARNDARRCRPCTILRSSRRRQGPRLDSRFRGE